MVHRLERHDHHFVCDGYRNDSAAGYGKLSPVSAESNWWGARVRGDRRIDLLARQGEAEPSIRLYPRGAQDPANPVLPVKAVHGEKCPRCLTRPLNFTFISPLLQELTRFNF